jgi:hypothetical protein
MDVCGVGNYFWQTKISKSMTDLGPGFSEIVPDQPRASHCDQLVWSGLSPEVPSTDKLHD